MGIKGIEDAVLRGVTTVGSTDVGNVPSSDGVTRVTAPLNVVSAGL